MSCANEPGTATLLKLQAEQRYSAASASVDGVANTVDACSAVADRTQAVDDIAASANWTLAAVGINDTLAQREAQCVAGTNGAGSNGLPHCPDNSAAVWNNASQQMQCRCNSGYEVNAGSCIPNKKTEAVNIACNTASKAGANPPETINVAVGRAQGTAQFSYDMYVEPDQMIVRYGGQILLDTGCVPGSKTIPLTLNGSSDQVVVSVKPSCRGNGATTKWTFTLGCPAPGKAASSAASGTVWLPGTAKTKADFGPLAIKNVTGTVRYALRSEPDFHPLTDPGAVGAGATLQLESNARVILGSQDATQVTLNGNSTAILGEPDVGKQVILLQSGSLEFKHTAIRS
jgi:hypothetical protein